MAESKAVLAASAAINRGHSFAEELRRHLQAVQAAKQQDLAKLTATSPSTAEQEPVMQQLGDELEQLGYWLTARFTELVRLLEISAELNKALILEDILARIYTFFKDVIPYDRIGCALIEDDGEHVTAYWAKFTYENTPQITPGYSAPLAGSSLQTIIDTGKPRIINDLEAYLAEHPESESTRKIVAEGIRSSLTCPLIADGRPVGFLFFSSTEAYTYDGLHQDVFLYLANQVAHLIEKSRLYQQIMDLNKRLVAANQQLQDKSARDALTGIYNRGAIMEFMQQQLGQSSRGSLAILMLDIDFFKKVNDTYGHLAGDLVLRTVANTIAQCIRPNDRIGRYGGEEFVAVLTDITEAQAAHIAERIRSKVAALEIHADEQLIKVTISSGGVWLAPTTNMQLSAALATADKRLYAAKRAGRDQVCFS